MKLCSVLKLLEMYYKIKFVLLPKAANYQKNKAPNIAVHMANSCNKCSIYPSIPNSMQIHPDDQLLKCFAN